MILPPRIFHREWLLLIHVGVISGVLDIRGDPVVTEVILDIVCQPSSPANFSLGGIPQGFEPYILLSSYCYPLLCNWS